MTPKQKVFVDEYLIDFNATRAAIKAGYSEKTAKSIGQENLTKPDIQEAIQEAIQKRSERTEITQDKTLKEMGFLGYSNIKNYIQASTKGYIAFKDFDKISEEDAKAIESIKVNYKEERIEFKLHSKTKTLEMIGRHLGMFVDEIKGDIAVTIKRIITETKPVE